MLYRDLPKVPCKAGCTDCCGPVMWSAEEWARVEHDAALVGAQVEPWGDDQPGMVLASIPGQMRCPFARNGACAVYERRPFICRLFGTVPAEPRLCCPHGCRPKRAIKPIQAADMRERYRAISAEP